MSRHIPNNIPIGEWVVDYVQIFHYSVTVRVAYNEAVIVIKTAPESAPLMKDSRLF